MREIKIARSLDSVDQLSGITLIALVVTIVVLLILASVSITVVFGDNGLLQLAKEAGEKTNEEVGKEQEGMTNISNILEEYTNGNGTTPQIPEGLEVGSTVTYNPSGTYKWEAKYCSSTKIETDDDVILKSATGENFNISSWKVLSINKKTGEVKLVPSNPTEGTVYLGQAQGYNNGVKLLNDACRNLYSNEDKGITARSIKIEDIEEYIAEDAIIEVSTPSYDSQSKNEYVKSNSYYPTIYAQENKSVINGQENLNGLGLSYQENFIEKTVTIQEPINETEKENKTVEDGKVQANTSIKPYQTYWTIIDENMKSAFKDNYYDLLIPNGTNTRYWVASRCNHVFGGWCYFTMRFIYDGRVNAANMLLSKNGGDEYELDISLFPVVTLSSDLIKSTESNGFSVSLK